MAIERRLAEHVIQTHPSWAATVLERLGEGETIRILERSDAKGVAGVVGRLSPSRSTAVLEGLRPHQAAEGLGSLPLEVAARLIRRVDEGLRSAILDRLPPRRAASIRTLLGFPEGSAGALMDPEVLALPRELSCRESLQRVRRSADSARYNLYVVDQEQVLVGVLNLRELLIAPGQLPLSEVMTRDPHRLPATADRAAVISHPGWRTAHSLPVVDRGDAYLGAIRYRALRELEDELRPGGGDADAGAAFGEVIVAGARGLLVALSESSGERRGDE